MIDPETYHKSGDEHSHQVALFIWAQQNVGIWPELELLHAIPNGEQRGDGTARGAAIAGGRLKAAGVKPGVSDLFLPVARHGMHGLYIEMKHDKATVKKVTQDQLNWIDKVRLQGYGSCVAFGYDEAKEILIRYLT